MDSEQWQEAEKFVPDRFDPSSDWYKKPDGKNRHPLTYNPFLGGKRICLGKTFAEMVVRFTIPILYYHLDFKLLNQEDLVKKPTFYVSARPQ